MDPQHHLGTLPPSARWVVRLSCRLRLRQSLAGSSIHMAVSSSSSYGLVVHLRLLSTPPHGDAGTTDYGQESVCPTGTPTPLTECPFGRTSVDPCGRPVQAPAPANRRSSALRRRGARECPYLDSLYLQPAWRRAAARETPWPTRPPTAMTIYTAAPSRGASHNSATTVGRSLRRRLAPQH